MRREKGITLITLAITIVVLIILASAGIYFGTDSIQSAKLTAFTTEIEIMQLEVNNLSQKKQSGDTSVDSIGKNLTNSQEEQTAFEAAGVSDKNGYRYYDQETIKELQLEGIKQEFLVNVSKRDVISLEGLKYEGNLYFRLSDLPNSMYNVEFVDKNVGQVDFDINMKPLGSSWIVEVSNITNSGQYVKKSEIYYKKTNPDPGYWNKVSGNSFEVTEAGIYNIKVKDSTGKEAIKTQYIYNKSGMIMCLDGENNTGTGHSTTTTTWKDLTGNGNDGVLKGFNYNSTSGWSNNSLIFDGSNDYILNAKDLDFNSSKQMTIEFVDLNGTLFSNTSSPIIFESSIKSNNYEGAFYINTGEYGTKNIQLAMKYSESNLRNHKTVNNILVSGKSATYTIVLDTTKSYNNFISIYKNGEMQTATTVTDTSQGNINNKTIGTYPFYIGSRAGTDFFVKMQLSTLRIYNKALSSEEIQKNYEVDKKRFNIQ